MCITLLYYSPSQKKKKESIIFTNSSQKKKTWHHVTRKQTKFFCFVKRKKPPKRFFSIFNRDYYTSHSHTLRKSSYRGKERSWKILSNVYPQKPSLERSLSPEKVTSCSHNDHSRHTWLHLIVSEVARRGARCDACHGTGNKVIHGQKPDLCIAAVTMQIDDTRRWFSC